MYVKDFISTPYKIGITGCSYMPCACKKVSWSSSSIPFIHQSSFFCSHTHIIRHKISFPLLLVLVKGAKKKRGTVPTPVTFLIVYEMAIIGNTCSKVPLHSSFRSHRLCHCMPCYLYVRMFSHIHLKLYYCQWSIMPTFYLVHKTLTPSST